MIPTPFLQDLLSRIDIAAVIGRHITLKKAGVNYKGLCPFHGEKTPSFIVSPVRQTYHCFGCGAHGDAIRFLVEHTGLGFLDAVQDLASQAGLQVPTEKPRSVQEQAQAQALKDQRRQIIDLLNTASTHYRQVLKGSPQAIAYLKQRGLTGIVAARFALGYAPAGRQGLSQRFPDYDNPMLETAGLVIQQQDPTGTDTPSPRRYDRFRNRIVFPIRNAQGEVLGFGARVIDRHGEPKYLNSPETPVFVKGRELYGLFEARTALRQAGFALVTEGYMDVVALAQHGLANTVATLGTACTGDHIHKLLRWTDRIVFAFDGDEAGRKAATRALEAALPHADDGRSFSFLFLPTEHDPDSYIRAVGLAGFEAAIAQATPLSRYLLELAAHACPDLNDIEQQARMLKRARPWWSALPTGIVKTQVLKSLAQQAHMAVEDLYRLWHEESPKPMASQDHPIQPPRRVRPTKAPSTEQTPWSPARWRTPTRLLDRVLWILLHRPALWQTLSSESQHRLAEQGSPYGTLLTRIERDAAEPLTATDEGTAEERALMAQVQSLHAPLPEDDLTSELEHLLRRLELQEIEAEQSLLYESGSMLSDEAKHRGRFLNRRQAELKRAVQST